MSDAQKPSDTETRRDAPVQACKSSTRNWYVTALNVLFAGCLAVILILDLLRENDLHKVINALWNNFIEVAKSICEAYLAGVVLLAVLLTHTFVMPLPTLCYFTAGPFVVSALAAAVFIVINYVRLLKETLHICYMIWYALAILWTGFTLVVSYTLPPWAPLVLGRVAAPEAQTETNVDPSSSNV